MTSTGRRRAGRCAAVVAAAAALGSVSPSTAHAAPTVTVPVGSHSYVTSGAGLTLAAFCGDRNGVVVATAPSGTTIVGSYSSQRLGSAQVDYTTVAIPFDGVTIASGNTDRTSYALAAAGSTDVLSGVLRIRWTANGCVVTQ